MSDTSKNWFDVSRKGLGKIIERRGKIHKPARLHHEHCSAKCEREAVRADRLSAAMEES